MTGRTILHYNIAEKLGEGGMGVVWKARDTHLDRFVAVKVLPAEKLKDAERQRRFVQEAKAASALNHPNIVHIYDIAEADGTPFIAMEYVPGKTLGQLIGRKGLPVGEALKYAIQIADALAKAHAAGIIHRDLKPSNIMVTGEGVVKVLDFGLAKLTEATPGEEGATRTLGPVTEEGTIVGTTAYMSPEQAEGKAVDPRSDIFSFGSVLYEMLTGRRAFQHDTKASTIAAILREDPKPTSQIVEGLPAEIERILKRCLRKDPAQRVQHMDDLKLALEELKQESDSGKLTAASTLLARPVRRWMVMAVAGGVLLAVAAALWWQMRPKERTPGLVLTRLTSDPGLTTDSALSPDGKLVAYASDRSGEGNFDIWLQQITGGEALRLTRNPADDYEPSFSPDGGKIVFRSQREGGGIYIVSTLGGEARKIADKGRNPRFSPDGSRVAYIVGDDGGRLNIVAVAGGSPQVLQPEVIASFPPLWSPDGKQLLAPAVSLASIDWWILPVSREAPIQTGALGAFRQAGLAVDFVSLPVPSAWVAGHIYFSAKLGDNTNLWRVQTRSNPWRITGPPERLTFGTTVESRASVVAISQGVIRLAFSSVQENTDIWSLQIEANQARIPGEPQQLTRTTAADFMPSVSADGKKVVFSSDRSGNPNIWLKDLETGREVSLTATPSGEYWPKISPDGSRVAFTDGLAPGNSIYVMDSSGGVPQKVCERCGRPSHWSSNNGKLLVWDGSVGVLDLVSGQQTTLLKHPEYYLVDPQFSPDGRWITFHGVTGPVERIIYVAPYRERQRVPPSEWIAITDGSGMDRHPMWSPDGNLLYFLSERDGFRCIWAQRLHSSTKQPLGAVRPVYHFHSPRRSLLNVGDSGVVGLGVARDKLVFTLGERTGNIWMATMEGQK